MSPRVPDPSELAEDLAEIKQMVASGSRETRDAIDALALKIETTYVRRDVYDARHTILEVRVGKVEERQTWTNRTAITAIVLPILVAVVAVYIQTGGVR